MALQFMCVALVVFVGLAMSTTTALSTATQANAVEVWSWRDAFYVRGSDSSRSIPEPTAALDCQVCFFAEPNFAGEKRCIAPRRTTSCTTDVLAISAPSSIGSIQFPRATALFQPQAAPCALVVNIRVLDAPYGQHVESIAADVADTGYNGIVEELFIAPSGTACFLAAKDANHFGRCYTESVLIVESTYRNTFYEVLLFKQHATDFDVVAYERSHFGRNCSKSNSSDVDSSGVDSSSHDPTSEQQDTTRGLTKRFTTSSSNMTVSTDDSASDALPSLQYKINSIEFVRPGAAPPVSTLSLTPTARASNVVEPTEVAVRAYGI